MTSTFEAKARLMALAKDDKIMFTPALKLPSQNSKARLMALARDDKIMFTPAPKPKALTAFQPLFRPADLSQNPMSWQASVEETTNPLLAPEPRSLAQTQTGPTTLHPTSLLTVHHELRQ
ncbi:hypothetical protein BLS_003339 [Venturia inaequalis]|nr:hypothetical protein EG328_004414 [Venturia inaequalis]KAE9973940.1 hypothetical protein BLS_003339 [Venturia inaequalis]RDI77846.1 hypothetical protein Vi05172_g12154 [Venturia inaequalis]